MKRTVAFGSMAGAGGGCFVHARRKRQPQTTLRRMGLTLAEPVRPRNSPARLCGSAVGAHPFGQRQHFVERPRVVGVRAVLHRQHQALRVEQHVGR